MGALHVNVRTYSRLNLNLTRSIWELDVRPGLKPFQTRVKSGLSQITFHSHTAIELSVTLEL